MLTTLLAGLVLLLVTVLIVLVATPLHLRLVAKRDPRTVFELEARTLWGIAPPLRVRSGGTRTRPRAEKKHKRPRKRRARGKWLSSGSFDLRRAAGIVTDTVATVFNRIRVCALRLEGVFGLEDPADTGFLYGLMTPALFAPHCPVCEISLSPDFSGPRLSGRAEAAISFTPLRVVWPLARAALALWRTAR